jgi:predicted nucleotidyltransferase
VALRGHEFRRAIEIVIDTFGSAAEHFVFLGSCVLGLYARENGAPLRATKDVDCVSQRSPWAAQLGLLTEMVEQKKLAPDTKVFCRYRIVGTDVDVDVMSPTGDNVPTTALFRAACTNAGVFELEDGRKIQAVTPAYFLALKLEAFIDRGENVQESKDVEDIICLIVEVATLSDDVNAAGVADAIADLWARAMEKFDFRGEDIGEVVDAHLHRDDRGERTRVIATLRALVRQLSGA